MLPPFHVCNIQSPSEPVCIDAPLYDETLSHEPRATLKYKDDDGDSITIGSSLELEHCLEEPTSLAQRRQLAELQNSSLTEAKDPHIFSVDSDQAIRDLWHGIREKSKVQVNLTAKDVGIASHTSDKSRGRQNAERLHHVASAKTKSDHSRELMLEDYRDHYFNATNPTKPFAPQKPHAAPKGTVTKTKIDDESEAPPRQHFDTQLKDRATTQRQDHKQKFLAANLTSEGRRQAQLAGEKFRARGVNYRPRKMSTSQMSLQSHHNRWAMYTSADGVEKSDIVREASTPDAKRQAQTAGDRLRLKTNRIRHAAQPVSSRGGDANRNCDRTDNRRDSPCAPPPKEGSNADSEGQQTLLELFESELARQPEHSAGQTKSSPLISHNRPTTPIMAGLNTSAAPNALAGRDRSSPTSSEAIENGIKNALAGFELCFRGIVDTLQAVQPLKSDQETLTDSARIFENLADKKFLSVGLSPQRNPPSVTHVVDNGFENNLMDMNVELPRFSFENDSSLHGEEKRERQDSAKEQVTSEHLPPIPCKIPLGQHQPKSKGFESEKPDQLMDLNGPFYYHRPGPIHLPQNDLLVEKSTDAREESAAVGVSIEDQQNVRPTEISQDSTNTTLQQHQDLISGSHCDRFYPSVDAATRFPTLRQFERSSFMAPPHIPLLPALIDRSTEEDAHPSRVAKPEDRETISEKGSPVTEDILTSSARGADSQLNPETRPAAHGDLPSVFKVPRSYRGGNQLLGRTHTYHHPTDEQRLRTVRRPYSTFNFTRDGRRLWDPVIGQTSQHEPNNHVNPQASTTSLPLPRPVEPLRRPVPETTFATNPGLNRSATNIETRFQRRARHGAERPFSSLVDRREVEIRKCVDHLSGLGFDMDRSRLRVYASVVNGDLEEAIDMITEDQKVHDSRRL